MNDLVNNVVNTFIRLFTPYENALPGLEMIGAIASLLLGVVVVKKMIELNIIGGKKDKFIDTWALADMTQIKANRAWRQIVADAHGADTAAMKKAINDADKMLGELLKASGFSGTTFDERLNKVDAAQMSNIKEVWQAHRLSERIKKEPTLVLAPHEAANIIGIYEKTFKNFGLID